LTEEQARVLEASPPVLISGTAGSGKTTLAVYYLLKPEFAGGRKLFLTYNPFLRDFSRRLYDGLTARTAVEGSASRPDFYVFRELLRDLLGSAIGSFPPDREVRLREFEALFRNHRLYGRYDAELVWEEVRSIIKGAKPGQARVYERMGLPEEAMGIWKKRGNRKDMIRLQKKVDKGEPAGFRLTLFEDREEKL
jgi:DNA helicase-2/ATP-dependent DNA helicase PcrA